MGKTKVLASIEWFTPAYQAGGIISSLANQVTHLSEEVEFWIVCSHQDLMGPLHGLPELDRWIDHKGYQVRYSTRKPVWPELLNEVDPQVVYINGIFNGPFCRVLLKAARNEGLPVILAAHGMLAPHALSIKGWLKKPWLWLSREVGAFKDIKWHASSAKEAQQIISWFPKAEVRIAQNLPPGMTQILVNPSEELQFLSVGRIHPIKNYGFTAECLAALAHKMNHPIKYSLIGPQEDENECDQILKHAGELLTIEFLGEKKPSELSGFYQKSTCLLVPSLSENFGVVVAEALGNGLPVLVSDQTPWGTFPASPALRCLPLKKSMWSEAMENLSNTPTRKALISEAQSYFKLHLIKEDIRQQHIALFS